MKSADGGKSWKKIKIDNNEVAFNKIYFVDNQNGWLISRDIVYKTEDSGDIWISFVKVELSCS